MSEENGTITPFLSLGPQSHNAQNGVPQFQFLHSNPCAVSPAAKPNLMRKPRTSKRRNYIRKSASKNLVPDRAEAHGDIQKSRSPNGSFVRSDPSYYSLVDDQNGEKCSSKKDPDFEAPKSSSPSIKYGLDWTISVITERMKSIFSYGWTLETLSCLLAVAALGGLVMTLAAHQDKPSPEWPQIVTLNSIVSIFSMIMRSAIAVVLAEGISQSKWQWFQEPRRLEDMERFDAASRSAWGSIVLLCRFGRRNPHWIAALGGFITISTALLGFFTQQLVQFHDCVQKDSAENVGLWKTNNYSNTQYGDDFVPLLHKATIAGMLKLPVSDANVVSTNCNTGNCTFPSTNGASFSTVGVAHLCEDITPQIYEKYIGERPVYAQLNVSTQSNSTLGVSYEGRRLLHTETLRTSQRNFANIGLLYTLSDPYISSAAINCSIFPSVNTYRTEIRNFKVEETLIEAVPMGFKAQMEYFPQYLLATSYTMRDGNRTRCEKSKDPGPGLVKVAANNIDAAPLWEWEARIRNDSDHEHGLYWYLPQDCVWYLEGIWSEIAIMMGYLFDNLEAAPETGPGHLIQLWQGGDITFAAVDSTFKNIATAITNIIRSRGEEGPSWQLKGHMWYMTTCVRIQWTWISVPVAMIFLSIVFLILVSFESRGVPNDRLWKSSVLAALFCEVKYTATKDATKPSGKQEMKDFAKSTSVRLDADDLKCRIVHRGNR